jgi:soluble lytic murein transglycosylase-like protein
VEVKMNVMVLNAVRAYAAIKSLFALVGVMALAVVFVIPHRPDPLLASLKSMKPAEVVASAAVATVAGPLLAAAAPAETTASDREQRSISDFIAKRYRIADAAAAQFVSVAYRAGVQHGIDPVLILAVMAIESRYNPVAESNMGAKGLMQVIARYHQEKLLEHGGEPALLEPEVNILVGAQILREYQRRFNDTETALQMYAGAFDEPTSQYANKVFAEKARLDAVRANARKHAATSA